MNLFAEAGIRPRIAQVADEKQTIINLVAAGLGSAVVPRWTAKPSTDGVRYLALHTGDGRRIESLPLAAAWTKSVRDPVRGQLVELLDANLTRYTEHG